MATITIDPTLKSLIPPLTPEEYRQLEANLQADGCHDPLIVWQEEQVLLDGHNRYDICTTHALPYSVQEISLASLDEAKAWMIANQLGRRNLTPDQMSYYRGEQYNLQKQRHGGARKSEASSTQNGNLKTVDRLAGEHGVSRNTIARDGAYAAAVETLAAVLGPDARQAILAGDLQLTRQDLPLLASLVAANPETVQAVQDALTSPDPVTTLKAIISTARCGICHRPLSDPASVGRGIGPICAGHGITGQDPTSGLRTDGAPILTEGQDPEPQEAAPSWWQHASSGDVEWYTPPEILALVRAVLGAIDVDPASCAVAQATVQARTFYTTQDDGLQQPWPGTVFLNPPYKLPDVARFIGKLYAELDAQRTTAAILLVNNATETDWFQRAFARAEAVCFPDGRIRFVHATHDGQAGPCVGQVLLYYGPDPLGFCAVFAALGVSTLVRCAEAAAAQLALAATPPAPDLADAPDIPPYDPTMFALGKLCANKHEWGQTGQTLRRKNGYGCQRCNTEKKRQQYAPRKEKDGTRD